MIRRPASQSSVRRLVPFVAAVWLVTFSLAGGRAEAAALALGNVSIDWSALSFSGISIEVLPDTAFSGSGAHIIVDGLPQDQVSTARAFTNTSASVFESITGAAAASGEASALTSNADVAAFLAVTANGGSATGFSSASREAEFIARESGMLTISIPFTILDLVSVNIPGAGAGILLNADVTLFSPTQLTFNDRQVFPFFSAGAVGTSSETIDGTLSASLAFESGQRGRFLVDVFADGGATTVPEPATLVMLTCGVAGLAARRRLTHPEQI